jgi:hypothetical protein
VLVQSLGHMVVVDRQVVPLAEGRPSRGAGRSVPEVGDIDCRKGSILD